MNNISFDCPPGLVLASLTDIGNGEWEPDPGNVRCNGEGDNSTEGIL